MSKLRIFLVIGVAAAGVIASLALRSRFEAQYRQNTAVFEQQRLQLAELTAQPQRPFPKAVKPAVATPRDGPDELGNLRREVASLRKQKIALVQQREEARRTAASKKEAHSPEYYEQLHKVAAGKMQDSMYLTLAFRDYADKHGDQFPTNLDLVASYLAKESRSLTGTNDFEIIYEGSLDELKNIPIGSVAVIRERLPWTDANGKSLRVYGMADCSAQMVEDDDKLQAWEAKHIIPPHTKGQ